MLEKVMFYNALRMLLLINSSQ